MSNYERYGQFHWAKYRGEWTIVEWQGDDLGYFYLFGDESPRIAEEFDEIEELPIPDKD